MPQAVDSNNTNASGIHPATALIEQNLDGLSNTFQAYRVIIESLPDTGNTPKPTPSGTDTTLCHLVEQFERQKEKLKTLVSQLAASAPNGPNRPAFKAVRDKFILELMEQGFSNDYIAQMLNLRLSFINKLTAELAFEADKENTAV